MEYKEKVAKTLIVPYKNRKKKKMKKREKVVAI